jgi:hypothetical protein
LRESPKAAPKKAWQEWEISRETDAKLSDSTKKLHAECIASIVPSGFRPEWNDHKDTQRRRGVSPPLSTFSLARMQSVPSLCGFSLQAASKGNCMDQDYSSQNLTLLWASEPILHAQESIDGFHNIAGEHPASLDWNQPGPEGQHYSSKPSVSCSAARSRTFSTHFL